MLDEELSDGGAKVVDDISFVLLADLLEELLVEQAEDAEFGVDVPHNPVDPLGLNIDGFAHLN
eukprot:CAMPEP_0170494442 /NCGR_PEP_ID=MMETSP0208-20121228/14646_1 /TAXON_ID=197538 /ORGANISM="Strombidium inclinatum, Strain S3" /LENGTH=62 /DNA_ID=CAMNT_0010770501 /DNA_START=971 /DNA_END=1156 /DNA_ORIENTATION=-